MDDIGDATTGHPQPCWTHPVLPDGGLGPARAALTPTGFKHPLKEFTLFPKLPLDLRVYIWRIAVNFERVVRVYEQIWDSEDEGDEDGDRDEDEGRPSIWGPEHVRDRGFWSNHGQKQLEEFGFTSSRPKPKLPNDIHQKHAIKLVQETTREGTFYSTSPIPVLLHVCQESRRLLQSYGYELAFCTRTASAQIWFNFSSDILDLHEASEPEYASPELDGGMWNIGQFSRQDLGRLRKLSLSLDWNYFYGSQIPIALHKAVQLCGNLKELLIVELDTNQGEIDMDGKNPAYWDVGYDDAEVVAVDLAVEEFWGHSPDWNPRGPLWDPHWGPYPRRCFVEKFEKSKSSYSDIAKDIEEQLRCASSFFPDRKEWSTPKVRFVMLSARHEAAKFMRAREAYSRYIDNMYWKKVTEGRKSYRPPSPLFLTDGMEAQHDNWDGYLSNYEPLGSPDVSWYKQAMEAIHSVHGWPSPFTMEWIEASEARLDMDSWPWAEG